MSSPVPRASRSTRAAAGSFVGGVIEWYDFFVYGTAAALVINDLFFPAADPEAGVLLAFATFGIAFAARPVGGVLFGHIGDRFGRRTSLLATLVLMGAATVLIGVLPTYATLGGWAVVLLVALRLLQGLAAGGELGGASALAVESAPPGRRGFLGAFTLSGASAGIALGSSVFGLVLLLPPEEFRSWGWRVPFLVSVLVVAVGVVVRRAIAEPAVFVEATRDRPAGARLPVLDVLRTHGRQLLVAVAVYSADVVGFYLVTVYSLSYAKVTLGASVPAAIVTAVTVTTAVNAVAALAWGALSDRVGRRPVIVVGVLVQTLGLFAFFAVLPSDDLTLILLATLGTLSFGQAAIAGVAPAYFSELFETRVRVTGISLGVGLSAVVGGAAPLLATAVVDAGDGWPVVAAIAAGLGAVAIAAVLTTRETRGTDIAGTRPAPADLVAR